MRINDFIPNGKVFDIIKPMELNKGSEKGNDKAVSFMDTLKVKLNEVNDQQLLADATSEAFIKGDDVDIHQVMVVAEEAKLSLQMAVQVRNKLVEAYQEINRIQL